MDAHPSPPRRVLVLTAPYGDGHTRAAEAIQEAMNVAAPGCEVEIVDYFRRFVPDVLTTLSRKAYLDSIRVAPASYGVFYHAIGKIKPDSAIRRVMDSPGRRPLARYLQEKPCDVVVSVYPIPSGAVAHLRRKGATAGRLVTVVTDYTCHPEWIHGCTDAYVVGDESVADLLVGRGVDRARIHALGIPVRAAFARAAAQATPVGQGQRLRVLVMAGAYGAMGGIKDVAAILERMPEHVEVRFVCGKADSLVDRLSDLTSAYRDRSEVLGFVHDVAGEMLRADLVIGKAGGITVSEALALGRPLLIYKPIPGQEQRNCDFLQAHGAGVAVRTAGDLSRVLRDLLTHPAELAKMGEAARRVGRPDAAWDVAQLVVGLAAGAEDAV